MRKIFKLSSFFIALMMIISSCKPEDTPDVDQDLIVSQFVYDGMSTYYYWADEVENKKPSATDSDPEAYFYRILNSTDKEHGWSWITDDADDLIAGFEGTDLSFGYNLSFKIINNKAYAFIKYVYPNTPAAKAGLQRLDLIGKLNGKDITTVQRDGVNYISDESYNLLYGNSTVEFTIYRYSGDQIVENRTEIITPDKSDKNPVLIDSIYTIGNKKIGYLFYTNFYDKFNYSLYEAFSKFKQNNITDLVLDLRYNTGGAVTSAIYLSSMIAPKSIVENKSPFVVMDYNDLLNTSFDKWYKEAKQEDKYKYDRKDYLGVYDSSKDQNPLNANLDLSKVYIIATDGSYSASELTLFCLRSYMNNGNDGVIHIGSNTGGKYTASLTIHAYNPFKDNEDNSRAVTIYDESKLSSTEKSELKNWAMQPIVAMYANKDGNTFNNPGYLKPDYSFEEGFGNIKYWTPLGDTKDVLLGEALYLISGDASYQPVQAKSTKSSQLTVSKVMNPDENAKPVIIEHKLSADDFQKLRELRN